MYSAEKENGNAPPPDAGKFVRIGIVALISVIFFALVANQAVILSMNVTEFAETFTKPLFFSLIGGIILAGIALIRVNIAKRSSIFWFFIKTVINFMNRSPNEQSNQTIPNYSEFKLSSICLLYTSDAADE